MQRKRRTFPTITVKCPRCGSTYATEKKYANSFKCFSCGTVCIPVSITTNAAVGPRPRKRR